MKRREFFITAGCACGAVAAHAMRPRTSRAADAAAFEKLDRRRQLNLADTALRLAATGGASYADIRIGRTESESVATRENHIEDFTSTLSLGFGVRVLFNGSWGFASSELVTDAEVARAVSLALEAAKASNVIQTNPIVLEEVPSVVEDWTMPLKADPFAITVEEKAAKLLEIGNAALKAGADYCTASLNAVREEKFFASSRGSRIGQTRVRVYPGFDVTVVDKQTNKFMSRSSLIAPRGAGFEYVAAWDGAGEAALASQQAREKLAAKSVEPGVYDLVLDPTNLWLTIHETVGHSTELDRALGWEANYAGTSFVTPDKLGTLQFGSPLMTIIADRSQEGGLSTVGFDDDGVRSSGAEFPVIEGGVFKNYQMAIGQAHFIGRERSNGCAYADSPTHFPIQRMPNVSLQPNPAKTSLDDLIGGVERGIYIVGNGSWSIDQQRDNFQFGGQLFYEIKNGKLAGMLRDVAYQGKTPRFWNSLDGIGDRSTYHLGGTFSCGKGQPAQAAPVSHGAVPSRFRQIDVLNTEGKDL